MKQYIALIFITITLAISILFNSNDFSKNPLEIQSLDKVNKNTYKATITNFSSDQIDTELNISVTDHFNDTSYQYVFPMKQVQKKEKYEVFFRVSDKLSYLTIQTISFTLNSSLGTSSRSFTQIVPRKGTVKKVLALSPFMVGIGVLLLAQFV